MAQRTQRRSRRCRTPRGCRVSITRPPWPDTMGSTTAMILQVANSTRLVSTHQGAIASNVSGYNCRQPAGNLGLVGPFRHFPYHAEYVGNISTVPPAGSAPCTNLVHPPRAVNGTFAPWRHRRPAGPLMMEQETDNCGLMSHRGWYRHY